MENTSYSCRVELGGVQIGLFGLPTPRWTVDEGLRRLVSAPEWDSNQLVLVWLEKGEAEDVNVMTWQPGTPEEYTEAERFHKATHLRSWRTFEELLARPRQPGKWLLRWRALHGDLYIATLDEQWLESPMDPGKAGQDFFESDPNKAAIMTHDFAIRLVPKLSPHFGLDESHPIYFEPIAFEDAIAQYERGMQ